MPLATFDALAAFAKYHGAVFTLRDLRRACAAIRVHHAQELPAEISGKELMEEARNKGWFIELPDGTFKVDIPHRDRPLGG